jgi:MoaA/NifB/PqqE/SkfB family radical SAM enzyme
MLSTLSTNLAVKYNEVTHQTLVLPLLIYYPTARCNSRCVSCDWWRSDGAADLSLAEIEGLVEQLPALGVRVVVFSGGEALLRREVYEIAELFRARGIRLHLLTAGLFLERDAAKIAQRFEQVTISLDGHTSSLYRQIRGVDGLAVIERGVKKFRELAPQIPLRARSTLHRHNFRELPRLIDKAHALGLAQISFLAADVTSEAFGRTGILPRAGAPDPAQGASLRTASSTRGLLLTASEVEEFAEVVEATIVSHASAFESRFVAETPDKLRRLPRYYAAQLGQGTFPAIVCNAPWVSVVIEADGAVRPCYFHNVLGNVRSQPLREILRHELAVFRASLDVQENPVCRKCVCTLKVGMRTKLW